MTENDWTEVVNFISDSYTIALLSCAVLSYLITRFVFKKAKENIFVFGAVMLLLFSGFKLLTSHLIFPDTHASNIPQNVNKVDKKKIKQLIKNIEVTQKKKQATPKSINAPATPLSISSEPNQDSLAKLDENIEDQPRLGKEITLEIPLYRYLHETHPEYYEKFVDKNIELLENSSDAKQSFNKKLTQTALKKLPSSSNKSIVSYTSLLLTQITELMKQNKGAMCYRILYPEIVGMIDGRHLYSSKTQEKELKVFTRILTEPEPEKSRSSMLKAITAIEPLLDDLSKQYKIKKDYVSKPRASGLAPQKACLMTQNLYSQILKLPEKQSLQGLRWLYTLNHL